MGIVSGSAGHLRRGRVASPSFVEVGCECATARCLPVMTIILTCLLFAAEWVVCW
eukprot:m.812554 g.812554  ORF g.812554 m.812554 type:complete len:55 (+) comp59344_c0_seq1:173-337(+)